VVVTVKAAVATIALALLVAGCSDKVTHREKLKTSFGEVTFVISSVGTAIDGERYDLIFENGFKEQKFFTGWDFNEFEAHERDGNMHLQMCHGWIEHAEPILIGHPPNVRLVRLKIDWDCLDKTHDV